MRRVRVIAFFLAALTLAASALTRADEVDDAYQNFITGRFGPVFTSLFRYRLEHEGTLRVDFMLAVSGCRLSDDDFRALGGFLLAAIPNWYSPLPSGHLADIHRQAQACPSIGITEQQAVSRVSGKSDVAYWKVTLDNIRGTHVYGEIARPEKGAKFPALLIVQWAGVYGLQKSWVTDRAAQGWRSILPD